MTTPIRFSAFNTGESLQATAAAKNSSGITSHFLPAPDSTPFKIRTAVRDAVRAAIHTNRFSPHGVALSRASPSAPPTKPAAINEIPNLVFSVIDASLDVKQ